MKWENSSTSDLFTFSRYCNGKAFLSSSVTQPMLSNTSSISDTTCEVNGSAARSCSNLPVACVKLSRSAFFAFAVLTNARPLGYVFKAFSSSAASRSPNAFVKLGSEARPVEEATMACTLLSSSRRDWQENWLASSSQDISKKALHNASIFSTTSAGSLCWDRNMILEAAKVSWLAPMSCFGTNSAMLEAWIFFQKASAGQASSALRSCIKRVKYGGKGL